MYKHIRSGIYAESWKDKNKPDRCGVLHVLNVVSSLTSPPSPGSYAITPLPTVLDLWITYISAAGRRTRSFCQCRENSLFTSSSQPPAVSLRGLKFNLLHENDNPKVFTRLSFTWGSCSRIPTYSLPIASKDLWKSRGAEEPFSVVAQRA